MAKMLTLAELDQRPHHPAGWFTVNNPHWITINALMRPGMTVQWTGYNPARIGMLAEELPRYGISYLPGGWDEEQRCWRMFRGPASSDTVPALFELKEAYIVDVAPVVVNQQCFYIKYHRNWYLLEKMFTERHWSVLRDRQRPASIYERQ